MSEQLPSGFAVEHATATPDSQPVVDLKKAVEKSRSEISESQNAAPKRGRGRPKKIKPETARPSVDATAAAGPIPSVETQKVDYSAITASVLKLPFDVAASKTRVAEIRVSDAEIAEPAMLASELVNIYMPALANQDPRTVIAWSFAASLGMLIYSKFSIYRVSKSRPENPAAENGAANAESDSAAGPTFENGIRPEDAFRARAGTAAFPQMNV